MGWGYFPRKQFSWVGAVFSCMGGGKQFSRSGAVFFLSFFFFFFFFFFEVGVGWGWGRGGGSGYLGFLGDFPGAVFLEPEPLPLFLAARTSFGMKSMWMRRENHCVH